MLRTALIAALLLPGNAAAGPGGGRPLKQAQAFLTAQRQACHFRNIRLRLEAFSERTFHTDASYVVKNVGHKPCVLTGFPALTVFNGRRPDPPPATGIAIPMADAGRPHRQRLNPGARAGFVVSFLLDPEKSLPCPQTEFVVRLPNQSDSTTLPPKEAFNVCHYRGGWFPLTVSPIEPFAWIPHASPKCRFGRGFKRCVARMVSR
jgi:hypothetical protein